MRKGVAAVGLCLLLCPAPAAAAGTVVPMERNQVATCVRDAGSGQLQLQAPLTEKTTPTDLLTASPERVERAAGTDLGSLIACPEAASGGGVTVIAGFSSPAPFKSVVLRAAVRGDLTAFEEPVLLDTLTGSESYRPAVAVGPRGDAVVAWQEQRGDPSDELQQVRVLAARRPAGPGARFGAVEEAVPWVTKRQPDFVTDDVAAGIDADGRVTIA